MREQLTPAEAQRRILDFAQEIGTPSWIIAQSFLKIEFQVWSGEFPLPFEQVFTGRIFGEQGEVRWNLEDDMAEVSTVAAASEANRRKEERRYYLWGTYKDKRLSEDIVGALAYPRVSQDADNHRPYITVVEYLAEPPAAGCSAEDLTEALNQSRVIGHRFKHFDAGIG